MTELSKEAKARAALASKAVMAAFGEIVSVLMRAPQYRQTTLAELEALVVPALMTRQFSLAEAQSQANGMLSPVAVVLWSSVSPEVDARLSANPEQPIRLAPAEWKNGDIIWIVESVGEPQVVKAMLKRVAEKHGAGREIRTGHWSFAAGEKS